MVSLQTKGVILKPHLCQLNCLQSEKTIRTFLLFILNTEPHQLLIQTIVNTLKLMYNLKYPKMRTTIKYLPVKFIN